MKITIIGFTGSGKSTLSSKLEEKYSIPVLHLDEVRYNPDWTYKPLKEAEEIIGDFLLKEDFIIEGNAYSLALNRFDLSDLIYVLNINRFTCFNNVLKRIRENKDKQIYKHKLTFSFTLWMLFGSHQRKYKKIMKDIINKYQNKVIVINSLKQYKKL
ncbi:MAG: hypothetical protein LBM99_04340 [Bacillales bacterium]|jgi:adenylate kinase family enzyme|nr:hypothetical protein [Bacillales bacterium]